MSELSPVVVRDYVRSRVELGEYSSASADAVRWTLLAFARHVGPVELETLNQSHVRRWIGVRNREPATIKSMLGKVRPFARWLVETGRCPRDFTLGIRSPKITLSVRGKGGRGRPTRSVPIPDEAWRQLGRFTAGRRHGAVIVSYQPPFAHLRAGSLSALVREWMTDAGIKARPYDGVSAHACRHTTAQDLVDAGHDLRVVQTLLGHRSIKTTEDYTRRDPPGLRKACEGRTYTA